MYQCLFLAKLLLTKMSENKCSLFDNHLKGQCENNSISRFILAFHLSFLCVK